MENQTVLILGGGINGAAIARELALNGIGVCLVDIGDLASGTTAASSRLIHGGLRYLEYAEFSLVRESLEEREILLRSASHLVQPIRLGIPVSTRLSGLRQTVGKLMGGSGTKPVARGLYLVQAGLKLYDWYTRDRSLPTHEVRAATEYADTGIDTNYYRWVCSYSDAQVMYPERLVLAYLEDGRIAAKSSGEEFEILTYHSVMRSDDFVEVVDETGKAVKRFRPAAIVNATGAWVDETLQRLEISSERLMGGTKGTHFITFHPALVKAVQAGGYYVEAGDGRPVFFLKFGEGVLVGTTDLRMEESPGDVRATDLELDYLVDAVQRVFPPFDFGRDDIAMHYCGVRPLPFVPEGSTSAITRRHFVRRHDDAVPPTYSIIGGKLTTARALGEEAAATILKELNCSAIAGSKERLLPGAVSLRSAKGLAVEIERLVKETGCRHSEVIASWPLVGNLLPLYFRSESHFRYEKSIHTEPTLQGESLPAEFKRLAGTPFSCEFVKGLIRREWVTKLDDLVERRLMLLYHPLLRRETIVQLANLLHECGLLDVADLEREVDRNIERMANRYGRRLE